MKKYISVVILSMLLVFSLCVKKPAAAPASSKIIKPNTNYSVKLNGKTKTLRVTYTTINQYDDISNYKILVNGSSVYSESFDEDDQCCIPYVKLLNMKNGKSYLWVSIGTGWSDVRDSILAYNGSKFTRVLNGQCLPGCSLSQSQKLAFHIDYTNVTVSSNTLTISYDVMSDALGAIAFTTKYAYKSGKLKRTSSHVSNFKMWKAVDEYNWKKSTSFKTRKEVKAYKAPTNRKVMFKVPANKNVTIKGLWINSGKMYLKITYSSKTGWLNAGSFTYDELFYDLAYAG